MHLRSRSCLRFLLLVVAATPLARAQSVTFVRKSQVTLQTNGTATPTGFSTTFTFFPTGRYVFSAQSPVASTLLLPNSVSQPLTAVAPGTYEFSQGFATTAALDTAFPNGVYRIVDTGTLPLTFTLNPESYPASEPAALRANWTNGLNVVDPAQSASFTFGGSSTYATAPLGAHMSFTISGLTDGVRAGSDIWNRALFGAPATPSPLTSFVLPAGTLTAGRVYVAELSWDIATTLDTTTVPGTVAVAAYSKVNRFYLVARGPNDPVPPPPVVTTQPLPQSAGLGGAATFNVGLNAAGATPVVLWFREGTQLRIDGTKYALNGASLTVNNITTADVARYFAHIVTPGGLVTTAPASLTLTSAAAIAREPVSVTVASGSTAVFSVAATGTPSPTYQWRLNNVNVPATFPGANSPTLVVPAATAAQAGTYTVVVANAGRTVTSAGATLALAPASAEPGRLANLSILTPLAAGEVMTIGTVLGGSGTAGAKPLLARAAGPALAPLGVADVLPNPALSLSYTSVTPALAVAANDDWQGDPALLAAFATTGAFPFPDPASRDAALFRPNLAPGNYTLDVRDAGTGSGTVIAELYDATPAATFTTATPRLINVSVLKSVAGGGTLTAGFVLGGATARTVLIRAVGPGLTPLGVEGAMPDPQLTLNATSIAPATVVATNNDWAGLPAIAASAIRIGAFAVNDSASRDAMLIATLVPGSYTAEVRPTPGTAGGRVIVEIYEVP